MTSSVSTGVVVDSATRFLTLAQRSLRDLGDGVRLRLLCLVRVVRARVDLQLLQQLPAEAVLGEHAPDRSLNRLTGVLVQEFAIRNRAEPTRVAGVPVGELGF